MTDNPFFALRFDEASGRWDLLRCAHCGSTDVDEGETWFLDEGRVLCPDCAPKTP